MKIALGCDHGGFALKQEVIRCLDARGLEWEDFGCFDEASCDYPDLDGQPRKRWHRENVTEAL